MGRQGLTNLAGLSRVAKKMDRGWELMTPKSKVAMGSKTEIAAL